MTSTTVHVLESFPATRSPGRPLDPPAAYRSLFDAERMPRVLLPSGREVYLAGHYDDVRTALTGPVSADGRSPGFPMARGGAAPSAHALSFLRMDGADHRVYRKLVTGDFTVAQISALRPVIQELTDELVADLARADGPADLVSALALPVPTRVICRILGIPYADREYFHKLSDTLTRGPALGRTAFSAAVGELQAYIGRLAASRHGELGAELGGDLLSSLMRSFDADPALDRGQLSAIILLLLVAGHEMIASTIALGALALMTDPQARETFLGEPEAAPNTVEELLRYTSVTQWVPRAVVEDFEVCGRVLRAGEGVVALPAMANRDAGVFPDPDRLDPHRANADRHVAFGFGPHQCVGLQLARAELQIVLHTLFQAMPRLRPAVPVERLRYRQHSAVYAVEALPVVR